MHGVNHGARCALPLTLTRELSIMRYASASERTVNSFPDSKLRYASALVLSAVSRYFCCPVTSHKPAVEHQKTYRIRLDQTQASK